jgi:putative radical SAM enzyme (TIGR03279 family)
VSPRADYASTRDTYPGIGGLVAALEPGGAAERAGIAIGDVVRTADGATLRDVVDWRWHADGPTVSVEGVHADGSLLALTLERTLGEAWGVEFADPLFDGIRTCANQCAFCFMTQLPKGLRRTLYVRDDDYRLSFLQGNFVTLTNLTDADMGRIAEQHLSPLYVSLHAVTPVVRARLVCARDDRALERFDALVEAGIDLHVQIVLVPGENDGAELDTTLRWLAEREGVLSVGVVPLGYTGHQSRFDRSFADAEAAAAVIDQLVEWREAARQRDGMAWVHAADEFYLNARRALPAAEEYDGFPQYENGIGVVRSFVDDIGGAAEDLSEAFASVRAADRRAVIVTGELARPVFEGLVRDFDAVDVSEVLPVANRFFGGNVSVAGLLTAKDITRAIVDHAGRMPGSVYLVPDIIGNADGLTLDDVRLGDLVARAGADVRLVSCDAGGMLDGLVAAATSGHTPDSRSR